MNSLESFLLFLFLGGIWAHLFFIGGRLLEIKNLLKDQPPTQEENNGKAGL